MKREKQMITPSIADSCLICIEYVHLIISQGIISNDIRDRLLSKTIKKPESIRKDLNSLLK